MALQQKKRQCSASVERAAHLERLLATMKAFQELMVQELGTHRTQLENVYPSPSHYRAAPGRRIEEDG